MLHQERPESEVLRLTEAHFAPIAHTRPPSDDAFVEMRSLPDDWRKTPTTSATGWYRIVLNLTVAPDRLWGLYAPGIEMTPMVFVNGVSIGGGVPGEPLPRYWNRPVYYSVPSGLLVPGENRIDVRVAANGVWGRLSEVYLGADQTLRPHYDSRYRLRVSALTVTTVGGFVVSAFIGTLFLARREAIYGWFALFALAWSLENYFVLTINLPIPNALWDLFVYIVIGFMLVTGTGFSLQVVGRTTSRVPRNLTLLAVIVPSLLATLILVDVPLFNRVSNLVWYGICLLVMSYPLSLMIRAIKRNPGPELIVLTGCYAVIGVLAVYDWLVVTGMGYRHDGLLLQFAAAPTFLAFAVVLYRRFIVAMQDSDQLNHHLESLVDEKTRELAAAFDKVREAESQKIVLAERERLMRDMHDGIGSQLIGTLSRLDDEDSQQREIAAELRDALQDLRVMIDSLDDVGDDLVVVLGLFRNRVQTQLDHAGLRLHWDVRDLPTVPGLGPERVLHLLRILQEAVTNAVKHASAHNLWIETRVPLDIEGVSCATILIRDDGVGMSSEGAAGRGLSNMQYRASQIGAVIGYESSDSGTCVLVGFPTDAMPRPDDP